MIKLFHIVYLYVILVIEVVRSFKAPVHLSFLPHVELSVHLLVVKNQFSAKLNRFLSCK